MPDKGGPVRTKLFHAIGWITARHMAHFEAQKVLLATIGAWFMKVADPVRFEYYESSMVQGPELQELKALSAALDIKELAKGQGGWSDHHGIGLDMVSGVLIEQHGWMPEDVQDFVEDLTDGYFAFGNPDDLDD